MLFDTKLFVVVGLSFDDGAGAVQLFNENHPHHLVGECHLGERELFVATLIDRRGETIRSSDDEDQSSDGLLLLLYPCGEVDAAHLLPMLIQQYQEILCLHLLQDLFTFAFFLLFLTEVPVVLQFGNGDELERHVVTEAFHIVIYTGSNVFADSLTYEYEGCLHALSRGCLYDILVADTLVFHHTTDGISKHVGY